MAMNSNDGNINRRMASGALWMGALRFVVRFIGLISTVVLARLLTPEDFGLVAMATSVIALLELATAFSFDIPLIQKQNTDRSDYDTAWSINLLFYAGLTAVLILVAQPAALFYQEPHLEAVIYVLAAGFLPRGLENIGIVQFRKELDFRKDFILMLSKKLVGVAITIPLAVAFRSYWALIAGIVLGNVVSTILTYMLHPFRPRFSLARLDELFGFSKWLMINNLVNFLRLRSPDFIIGRVSGAEALGLFSVAHEIAITPSTELVAPINRAVFPGYSKLARDTELLRRSFLDVLAIIATIALPAGLGLSAIAVPLVDLILGDQWTAAAPIVAIMAAYGSINALQANNASVFYAIRKPYLATLLGVVNIVVLVAAATYLALRDGPTGVAWAYLGTVVTLTPFNFVVVCHSIRISARRLIGVLWRPMAASFAMYACLRGAAPSLVELQLSSALHLLFQVAIGMLVYCLVLIVGWIASGRPQSADYRMLLVGLEKLGWLSR